MKANNLVHLARAKKILIGRIKRLLQGLKNTIRYYKKGINKKNESNNFSRWI